MGEHPFLADARKMVNGAATPAATQREKNQAAWNIMLILRYVASR